MDKLTMAHDWAMNTINAGYCNETKLMVKEAWDYADTMQAEADERSKAEAEQKRKAVREMLNADNTFLEKEGQHFDDVEEWQPDWSQAPDNMTHFAVDKNGSGWFFNREPHAESDCCWYCGDDSAELDNHNYQGNWQDSLRKRPSNI